MKIRMPLNARMKPATTAISFKESDDFPKLGVPYWVGIEVTLGSYWGYIGIMENRMATTT